MFSSYAFLYFNIPCLVPICFIVTMFPMFHVFYKWFHMFLVVFLCFPISIICTFLISFDFMFMIPAMLICYYYLSYDSTCSQLSSYVLPCLWYLICSSLTFSSMYMIFYLSFMDTVVCLHWKQQWGHLAFFHAIYTFMITSSLCPLHCYLMMIPLSFNCF